MLQKRERGPQRGPQRDYDGPDWTLEGAGRVLAWLELKAPMRDLVGTQEGAGRVNLGIL